MQIWDIRNKFGIPKLLKFKKLLQKLKTIIERENGKPHMKNGGMKSENGKYKTT